MGSIRYGFDQKTHTVPFDCSISYKRRTGFNLIPTDKSNRMDIFATQISAYTQIVANLASNKALGDPAAKTSACSTLHQFDVILDSPSLDATAPGSVPSVAPSVEPNVKPSNSASNNVARNTIGSIKRYIPSSVLGLLQVLLPNTFKPFY